MNNDLSDNEHEIVRRLKEHLKKYGVVGAAVNDPLV